MLLTSVPQSDAVEDSIVQITYNCYFGKSWEEYGVAKVDGFLTALGFSTPGEVANFCASTNVFEAFSTDGWMQKYVNVADRQIISKFGKAGSRSKFSSDLIQPLAGDVKLGTNPSYADFFQVLFTWLTHGDSVINRKDFIEYWANPQGYPPASSGMRNPYHVLTDTSPCRKSFKDAVEAFLKELRAPKSQAATESALVNTVHALKLKGLSLFLNRSSWSYISGTGAGASVSALKFVSVGTSASSFAVFENSNAEKVYPLLAAAGNVGVGAGAALPVSVTVDPAEFPSKGTVFHGLRGNATGIHSFCGTFVAIGGGLAAYIFNQTTSLMFIAPHVNVLPMVSQNALTQMFLEVAASSTAILALDGHGIEVGVGVSGQISYGAVGPQPR